MKLPSWGNSIWKWVVCNRLIVSLLAVLGALSGMVWWCGWDWFATEPCGMESRSTTLRNLVLAFGGIIALILAVWRLRVADRQSEASEEQAETSRIALLHDRYQRGAEMLGHRLPTVRWSGILSLRYLAEDEPEEYCAPIVTLLTTFVISPHTPDMTVEVDRGDVEFARNVVQILSSGKCR